MSVFLALRPAAARAAFTGANLSITVYGREVETLPYSAADPLVFATDRLASGIYLAVLEVAPSAPGGPVERTVLKVAVVR